MLRRLFAIVSVVSLALCASTVALWSLSTTMKSEVAGDSMDADRLGRSAYSIAFEHGVITFRYLHVRAAADAPANFKRYFQSPAQPALTVRHDYYPASWGLQRWSFRWTRSHAPYVGGRFQVAAPCWVIFLLTAIAPGLWLRQRVRRRTTLGLGFCDACGYDLRASPDRCPECGKAVTGTSGRAVAAT
jgi:hypothetical protein